MEAIAAAEQLVKILNKSIIKNQSASRKIPTDAPLGIHFDNVSFAYEPGHQILENINFNLKQGERIVLIGPSGSGKSTLSHLLFGFMRPHEGRITINNIDLCELNKDDWLDKIAWLPQRPTLFHGTLLDNIRLGRPEIKLNAVRQAARLANADSFIKRLPQGYDTLIGDRGQGLSGGEIQRIALARAFLKNARLVVLDEASASLDPETEALINDSIERLALNRSILAITHRLSTIQRADHIIVLDGGRIVEQGNHCQLVAAGGMYTKMATQYPGGGGLT